MAKCCWAELATSTSALRSASRMRRRLRCSQTSRTTLRDTSRGWAITAFAAGGVEQWDSRSDAWQSSGRCRPADPLAGLADFPATACRARSPWGVRGPRTQPAAPRRSWRWPAASRSGGCGDVVEFESVFLERGFDHGDAGFDRLKFAVRLLGSPRQYTPEFLQGRLLVGHVFARLLTLGRTRLHIRQRRF